MPHYLKTSMFVAALALSAPASAATAEDGRLNAVYTALTKARAANDVAGMSGAFASEGILVDARPGPAIAGGELAERLQPMVERLRTEGVRISTAYRVERRSLMENIALDAGFMRQTLTRPDGQSSTRYARFLVTMKKAEDGNWRIIGDASMPATEAAFAAVPATSGLHRDD